MVEVQQAHSNLEQFDAENLPSSIKLTDKDVQYYMMQAETSRQRILALSKPKESKQIWLTSFGPKIHWGKQDMMWPISDTALRIRPTQRLMQLANPKKNFQLGTLKVNRPEFVYSCGRNSQIWEVGNGAKSAEPSERIKVLAQPKISHQQFQEKNLQHQYSCGRMSPIWKVSPSAIRCTDRPRTAELALPKQPHFSYMPSREVETDISRKALRAMCSARVEELSRPKTRSDGPFIDSRAPEDSIWRVTKKARAATAGARVLELAKVKGYAEGYVANRPVQWSVSKAARRAASTPRIDQLSKPIIRDSMDHLQFNPDAFLVSELAKKARCTPRLEELSQPIQR